MIYWHIYMVPVCFLKLIYVMDIIRYQKLLKIHIKLPSIVVMVHMNFALCSLG